MQADLSDWMSKSTHAEIEEKNASIECIFIHSKCCTSATTQELCKTISWFLPNSPVKCCADPKLSFIKSLTDQHFFSFSYFIFVIALLPNTKRSSPHSMPSLNLIKKYSLRKPICESNTYFMPKLLWNMNITWQRNQVSALVSRKKIKSPDHDLSEETSCPCRMAKILAKDCKVHSYIFDSPSEYSTNNKTLNIMFSTHSPVSEFVS